MTSTNNGWPARARKKTQPEEFDLVILGGHWTHPPPLRACRTRVAEMVQAEEHSPPGLPDAAENASVGRESHHLSVDPCPRLVPGKRYLEVA
jgi:hypothetical protein